MMKSISITVLALCIALTCSIPYHQQIALLSSLEVGRNEDPMAWTCVGCDDTNKPIHSYVIEEKGVEIRSILSVYEEYTVLAFRYTANLKNVWQDILWAFQVDLSSNLDSRRRSPQGMQGSTRVRPHVG
jgi:hypothetical protein